MLGKGLSKLRWESEMRVKSASKSWGGFYERRAKFCRHAWNLTIQSWRHHQSYNPTYLWAYRVEGGH